MTTTAALEGVKHKQQQMWASGDYAVIGTSLQLVGEQLCESVDVSAGWQVLDVAAGNGNASLAASRRGCDVIATDYVDELLVRARRRAEADGLPLVTRFADAEDLPFTDASFDAVLSTFGVMFVPDPERAAAELLRVTKPDGRIGLASWTPTGFVGKLLRLVGQSVPPPPGVPSPSLWGTAERAEELLGSGAHLQVTTRQHVFRYRSSEAFVDTFVGFYGPTVKAWAALDDGGRAHLRAGIVALLAEHNRATDGSLKVPSDYLEIVASRS